MSDSKGKRQRLRDTMSRSWPANFHTKETRMTIHMDDVYRVYSSGQDPRKLFARASEWFGVWNTYANASEDKSVEECTNLAESYLLEALLQCVFGSNFIERAGLGLDDTNILCKKVFSGEGVEIIDERTPEYERRLNEYYANTKKTDFNTMPLKAFIHGRTEVVNHAKALQYMLDWVVSRDQPISEECILNTHRILCIDTDIELAPDEHGKITIVPAADYAGKYRTVVVGAGNQNFVNPNFVPAKMSELVSNLQAEMETAKATGKVDPISLAAKYSYQFVQIHPFQDGNGRTCRIILNVILCKFLGVVVAIGMDEKDREEYIDIKRRGGRDMEDHGEYSVFVLEKVHRSLRKLKKKTNHKKGDTGAPDQEASTVLRRS
ncbi:Fic family protein [Microdochium nivale]|nr:Fic family protein [Microdochium nivale]